MLKEMECAIIQSTVNKVSMVIKQDKKTSGGLITLNLSFHYFTMYRNWSITKAYRKYTVNGLRLQANVAQCCAYPH